MSTRRDVNRWIDGPSALLALAAVAMWLMWPDIQRVSSTHPRSSGTVFSAVVRPDSSRLYQSPDVFALPSPMGFSKPGPQTGMPELPSAPAPRSAHNLDYSDHDAPTYTPTPTWSYILQQATAPTRDDAPTPRSAEEGALTLTETPPPRIRVEPTGCLEAHGFTLPSLTPEESPALRSASAWMITLAVNVAPDGSVAHVFIEKGCDDAAINDRIVRWAAKGRLTQPGTECRGRVYVNFGTR